MEATEQATATDAEAIQGEVVGNESLAVASSDLSSFDGFDGFDSELLAELSADIEDTLKQISVTDFKGAKAFLDQPLTLLDAFPFDMPEESSQTKGEMITVPKIMYSVVDGAGEVHNVMQNLNSSRQRFITLYAKVKTANKLSKQNKTLTLTNVIFTEVGAPKRGNRAIVLKITPDTKILTGDAKQLTAGA